MFCCNDKNHTRLVVIQLGSRKVDQAAQFPSGLLTGNTVRLQDKWSPGSGLYERLLICTLGIYSSPVSSITWIGGRHRLRVLLTN